MDYKKAKKHLAHLLDRHPTLKEIATELNLSEDYVEDILRAAKDPFSLDTSPDTKENCPHLYNKISSCPAEEKRGVTEKELKKEIENILFELNSRERFIITMHFGLHGKEKMTLKEIGNLLDISLERVRQIENTALEKMQTLAKKRELHLFLT